MNKSESIRQQRMDLSPYLFHFISGYNPSNPKEVLKKILKEKRLLSNRLKYICFTEAPLCDYVNLLSYFDTYSTPMYTKYGIGFKREVLLNDHGAMPVIYGSEKDSTLINPALSWRFERLQEDHDFSWLREWRINQNPFSFDDIDKKDILVVAPTVEDLEQLTVDIDIDVDFSYESDIHDCVPYLTITPYRDWLGMSIKKLEESNITDHQISERTAKAVVRKPVKLHDEEAFSKFNPELFL